MASGARDAEVQGRPNAPADRPGVRCQIRIAWTAFTTVAPGLVAHEAPGTDVDFGEWNLTHAPTGLVLARCGGAEQAQAIAAQLVDVDWMNLDTTDKAVMSLLAPRVLGIVRELGGRHFGARNLPPWEEIASGE